MSSPLFNPETAQLIQQVANSLPQGLLLEGAKGVGLMTAARYLAGDFIAAVVEPTDINDSVDHEKGIIRVKQVRAMYESTKGKSISRRVYVIDNADTMNHSAQNALLKLLEEPADNIHFILTAHQPHKLLPTIRSRLQTIRINNIDESQTMEFIAMNRVVDQRKISQLVYIASGRPAELARLIKDETYFSQQSSLIADARTLIQGSMYEKYLVIHKYYSDRSKTLQLIICAQAILSHSITQKPTRKLIETADKLTTIYDRIEHNGNVRIQLLAYVL